MPLLRIQCKASVKDLIGTISERMVVPNTEIVHDRMFLKSSEVAPEDAGFAKGNYIDRFVKTAETLIRQAMAMAEDPVTMN